ncbi:hypothetical protein SODALDRAFT_332316 [Sodiomyces alkalinus F11]|uniref:Uncharacterized protein n=1 Tax=Sodiomyces alkalinus (strain CBS 110278 / VKM F-3762 / F11) TaxID=1314773 RepID=A0A3N2PWJ5_SODAK|nr:hypothetical protein SODALDRAFT_332316 [Sodiomyces alkalinus F11]ROT38878.1 hypothetical protein SODALDRAFT_332316 [Sodiomyces alkalinus F11]
MDIAFDPVRCAELHNQLLAKAIAHIPGAAEEVVRGDVITRLLDVAPEWADMDAPDEVPIYRFLSLLDSYRPLEVRLTPEFWQPVPAYFWNDLYQDLDSRDLILLYPDNTNTPIMDGGLFLNLDTNLVHWGRVNVHPLPPDESWVPLELALTKALDMWECGKFHCGPSPFSSEDTLSTRPWTERDLEDAVSAWDELLTAIRDRLPLPPDAPRPPIQDPLPSSLVEQFDLSPFAKAFLTTAKRPSFAYVAPGHLTTFTRQSFADLYAAETPDAPRRAQNANAAAADEYASLVLPATLAAVPEGAADPSFDKDHGHAKFTINRRAGLYTDPTMGLRDADSAWLLTAEGSAHPVRFVGQRPWGAPRGVRFAEMFSVWADWVRDGVWEVSIEGVATTHAWFTDPATAELRELQWTETCR